MTVLWVQAAACTLFFFPEAGFEPRAPTLNLILICHSEELERRGICCPSILVKSRFLASARNDKGLGFVEAGLDTLLLVIPRSRGDEESAVLQFLSKADFSLSLDMTMMGIVEDHTFWSCA